MNPDEPVTVQTTHRGQERRRSAVPSGRGRAVREDVDRVHGPVLEREDQGAVEICRLCSGYGVSAFK